jgi:polar amino acid transport system permease protein
MTTQEATKPRLTRRQRSNLIRWSIYAAGVLLAVLVVLFIDWGRLADKMFKWELITEQFPEIITRAARNSIIYTFFSFFIGLAGALVLALMRRSKAAPFRWFAAVYIEIFRGLPALLTIIIIGLGLPIALGVNIPPRNWGPGILALAMVAAAYMAETIRAGIEAVPRGQMEAARSLGMSHASAMKSIVLPQAFRIIIPPLTNELVLLLKDSSLISVLGVTDLNIELTRWGRNGVIDNANATPLIVAGLVYLALTIPLTRLAARLEKTAGRSR